MTTPLEQHFVRPLVEFYGKSPFGGGFAARLAPFAESLSPEALDLTASKLIEKGAKTFPSFGACRAALDRAKASANVPGNTSIRRWDYAARGKADREQRLQAIQLIRDEGRLGRVADREGWLPALIDYCRDHGSLPGSGREIDGVKAVARRSEDGLERSRGSPIYGAVVKLRQAMLDGAHRDVFAPMETLLAAE